jgi:hypothetical protein
MIARAIATFAAVLAVCATASAALAAPKPAAKPPAHKPAAATPGKPAAPASGPFDARNPASLMALLASMGAQGEITTRQDDVVALKVSNPAYSFAAQYAGCDSQGRACKAVAFSGVSDARTATLAQINAFNQTSINCHAYQDNAGKPHAWYAALVFASTTREDMITHIGAWQGCWSSFGAFLKDPAAYLASAP